MNIPWVQIDMLNLVKWDQPFPHLNCYKEWRWALVKKDASH